MRLNVRDAADPTHVIGTVEVPAEIVLRIIGKRPAARLAPRPLPPRIASGPAVDTPPHVQGFIKVRSFTMAGGAYEVTVDADGQPLDAWLMATGFRCDDYSVDAMFHREACGG